MESYTIVKKTEVKPFPESGCVVWEKEPVSFDVNIMMGGIAYNVCAESKAFWNPEKDAIEYEDYPYFKVFDTYGSEVTVHPVTNEIVNDIFYKTHEA